MVMIVFLSVFIFFGCGCDKGQALDGSPKKDAEHASSAEKVKPEDVHYLEFVKAVAEEIKKDQAFKESAELAALKQRVDMHDGVLNGLTNRFGMKFKYVQPDVFMMGTPVNEPGRDSDETLHQVTLTRAFMMQTTEVTQGQWKAVLSEAKTKGLSTQGLKMTPAYFKQCGDDCPVESVSWVEVNTWIKILNQLDQSVYSLPTEAQWEYAARSDSASAFAIGEITETDYTTVDPVLDIIGWYFGNADGKTHPTAKKAPNLWGLYDMHGNVWEWCVDWYDDYRPGNATDPVGPGEGIYRVLRGGGWVDSAAECRAGNRFRGDPVTRGSGVGFRLIRGAMVKGRITK